MKRGNNSDCNRDADWRGKRMARGGSAMHNVSHSSHETYFIYTKFNSHESCVWQVARVIQVHAAVIDCARARARTEEKRFIYLCVRFPRDCHRLINWIRSLSIYESLGYFFRRGCKVHRYITGGNGAYARAYGWREGTSRIVIFAHLNFARECLTAVSGRSCLQWRPI